MTNRKSVRMGLRRLFSGLANRIQYNSRQRTPPDSNEEIDASHPRYPVSQLEKPKHSIPMVLCIGMVTLTAWNGSKRLQSDFYNSIGDD